MKNFEHDTIIKKTGLLCVVSLFVFFSACSPEDAGETETEAKKDSTLEIVNDSSSSISNIKWKDNPIKDYAGNLTLGTGYSNSYGRAEVPSGSDYLYFTREGTTVMNLRTLNKITVSGDTSFTLTNSTMVAEVDHEDNTGALSTITPAASTTGISLTIKNQSFSDLLNVEWQGIAFASNTVENSLTVGNTVNKKVAAGTGYIFFKRKSNPAFARTRELVMVGEKETVEFTFTDNTLIVEANNPDNTGTLKNMTTTVVFFDDAEGDIQNYAERKGSAYYADEDDLPYSYYDYFHPPYTGSGKSIALGGMTDAKLRLTLNLERRAKLSFWFANKDYNTNGAKFSIDGTEQAAWQGDYNWSNQEYTLEAGSHEIVWTKHGYYYYFYTDYYAYLSLDNILVYYIE
ncbi:MAG: hypothetical protein LBP19_09535 [Treponema sp.]|nr:hypothetical protein [Treponema sp.]